MGLLFSKVWSFFTHEGIYLFITKQCKIVILIRTQVGHHWPRQRGENDCFISIVSIMTTLIFYHCSCSVFSLMEEVVQTSPTLGSNVEEVVWKNIHFVMWDLGGQDSLRQGWQAYYAKTEVK